MSKEKNNSLGTIDGWAIGTGAMMGCSIFVVSGTASGIAGPSAAAGFFLASLVAMIVAICYSEIATAYPETGGAYVYPRKVMKGTLGECFSFCSGWALFGGQGLGSAIVAVYTAEYLNWTLRCFGINDPVPTKVIAFALIIFYALLNMRNLSGGKMFQLITTLAIAGIMAIYCVWGAKYIDVNNFKNFFPNGGKAFFTATAMALMSYGAWSVIPSMGTAFRKPSKNIPMSMLLSLISCGLVFGLFVLVMNGMAPYEYLGQSSTPSADAFLLHNKYGALIIAVGGIFACVSSSNSHVMTSSRIPYKMSRDGSLPKILGRENENGVPTAAVIFLMCCQLVVAATGTIELLVEMIVFVTSVSWLITLICALIRRVKYPDVVPPFKMPGYPVILIIAFAVLIFMMTRFTAKAMIIGTIWILLGVGIYFLFTHTGLKTFCKKMTEE